MLPHETLVADPHERYGLLRTDDAWLAHQWARPESRALVISGTRVRPGDAGLEWIPTAQAPDGVRLLLGERDDAMWWAVIVGSDLARTEPDRWFPLRGLLPYFTDDAGLAVGQPLPPGRDAAPLEQRRRDAPLVFHALGLAEWLWSHRHCPRCGGRLEPRAAGHEQVCLDCGKPQFPRSDPAVIMLIAHGEPGTPEEKCLLGRHPSWPARGYSTLAGFCEPGETLEDAVRREVEEETGVIVGDVDYVGNQPWPLPASLMLGFIGQALTDDVVLRDRDVEDARWFTRDQLRDGATSGELVLPGGVSISRSLVERWYGGPLPRA